MAVAADTGAEARGENMECRRCFPMDDICMSSRGAAIEAVSRVASIEGLPPSPLSQSPVAHALYDPHAIAEHPQEQEIQHAALPLFESQVLLLILLQCT